MWNSKGESEAGVEREKQRSIALPASTMGKDDQSSAEKIVVQVDPDLEDLIYAYLQKREQDIKSLLLALEKGDYETIRVLGHSMKGSGGGYGFDTITEMGGTLEQAAKDKDSQEISRRVGELASYLKRVEVVFG